MVGTYDFSAIGMNNYKKMSLKEMLNHLEGNPEMGIPQPTIVDKRVDTRLLKAIPTEKTVELNIPEVGQYPLNAWAHSQMSEKTRIPKPYYDRMMETGRNELLADNINSWLPEKDERMIRILNGEVRAILSSKYRIIDNVNVLRCTMETLVEGYKHLEPKFQECWLGDTRMYLKIALMGLNGEARPEDKYHFGMIVTNSEVGAGMLKLEPYMIRQICTNGMIRQKLLSKIHIGSANTDIEVSAGTRLLQDSALYGELRDAINTMLNEGGKGFAKWLNDLEMTTQVQIDKPVDAVGSIVSRYKISESNAKLIEDYFMKEQDCTQYGLIQGITRAAQDFADLDERIRMEGLAGELSELDGKAFTRMIKVVA